MIRTKKKYLLTVVAAFIFLSGFSQRQKARNLMDFDNHDYHFGFMLSYNSADFFMEIEPDYTFTDSIISMENFRQPGFNLGIIGSWNMTKNISLRFLPDLSFQDRLIKYTFLNDTGGVDTEDKRVESTFLDFPLNLKLRTDRINNFAAYAIGGYNFGIDMASQKDVNNAGNNSIIKIQRIDHGVQVGGGLDFFLPYFKFGIELKVCRGMRNLLIQDNTKFADPISVLRSKMWVLSFTFEG